MEPSQSSTDRSFVEFMLASGRMLKLDRPTVSTAFVYFYKYQEFYRKCNAETQTTKVDDYTIATTCLHLACKNGEVPRKLREIINVAYWLVQGWEGGDPYLAIGDQYWIIKDSIMKTEMILLRVLGFSLQVDLPYTIIIQILQAMSAESERRVSKPDRRRSNADVFHAHPPNELSTTQLRVVAEFALCYASDAYASEDLVSSVSPSDLAAACVYLAMRCVKATPPKAFYEICRYESMRLPSNTRDTVVRLIGLVRQWRAPGLDHPPTLRTGGKLPDA
ncbi:cyclin-like protein [Gaertneriomyces semiglobifer]|nr:cyclin-like protein [Gaertneriomyces semiglobifer]